MKLNDKYRKATVIEAALLAVQAFDKLEDFKEDLQTGKVKDLTAKQIERKLKSMRENVDGHLDLASADAKEEAPCQ